MHRPTRQHRDLERKISRKTARVAKSQRKPGKKTKRLRKYLEGYAKLCGDHAQEEETK